MDYSAGLDAIRDVYPGDLVIQGGPQSWERVEVRTPQGKIRFTTLVQGKPGDRFSKLTLGMHNFVSNIETPATANKRLVLDRVANATMFIGILAEPEFVEEDHHFACIWWLAERLNAIVFSGEAALNAEGLRLLDRAGETDIPA